MSDGSHRSFRLDMIVAIVTGTILLVGAIVLVFLSRFTKTIPVAPRSRKALDSYTQAALRFRRMFQRRPFTASPTASTADSSEHGREKGSSRSKTANFHSNIEIEAQKHRRRRLLENHSMGMDLSVETNIFYTMTNLPNHIVATSQHLEYCFNDSSALSQTLQFYQQQLVNQSKAEEKWKQELQLAYLPPIAEVRSVESGSPAITPRYYDDLSASSGIGHIRFPPHDFPPRRQIPRAIFLFSGPEDRDLWLFPEDDEEEEDEPDDFSSDECDEKAPDVENQTLGTINVRQSTDSDIDVMYLSDLSSSGDRNGTRRSWSPTSKRRRTNRSPRQSRMNSFASANGTQLSPIDEHNNTDEMETSRQQQQQQRLSQWMQLLRQPPLLAWPSLSPKHHSPKSTETDNKTEHASTQQQLQDGETLSPSLPDTEGATARTVMVTPEALPPFPGSLYPRQLHPISLDISQSKTDTYPNRQFS